MPVEKTIDAADLMSRLEEILEEIHRDGVVYFVRTSVDGAATAYLDEPRGKAFFVLGPEDVCGRVPALTDPELDAWSEAVDIRNVKSVLDLAPASCAYPKLVRDGICLAVGVSVSDYWEVRAGLGTDRVGAARDLVEDVLAGKVTRDTHPWVWEDDLLLFNVALLQRHDRDWLVDTLRQQRQRWRWLDVLACMSSGG